MTTKRQSFLRGAALLAAAGVAVKVIGACYKIPLGAVLGPVGMANFSIAYNIYALLFVLSTAGVPSAVAKMVAEAYAEGDRAKMQMIYRSALSVFAFIGVCGTVVMFFGADVMADLMGNRDSALAIKAISPAVFFVAISAINRGYHQGCSDMRPTAVSEIFEATGKLIIGLFAAIYLERAGKTSGEISAGAVAGVSAGALFAAAYLMMCRREKNCGRKKEPSFKNIKRLFSLAVPITLGAAVMSLTNVIDSAVVMNLLIKGGCEELHAKWLFGAYNYAATVFNLPSALVTTLATAMLPALSGAFVTRDYITADKTANTAVMAAMLTGLPAACGMAALAYGITDLLYGAGVEAECILTASRLLKVLAIAVPALSVVTVTNAIFHAFDSPATPVKSMVCGALVKIISNIMLVSNPQIGIYGAAISTALCYFTIAIFNIIALKKYSFIGVGITAIMTAAAVVGAAVYFAAKASYGVFQVTLNGRFSTVLSVFVGVFAFVVSVFCVGAIRNTELKTIFKEKSIFKFLNND